MLFLLLFTLTLELVIGIKFPGRCPQMPPTKSYNETQLTLDMDLIVSIPFSPDHHAYPFIELTRARRPFLVTMRPHEQFVEIDIEFMYESYAFTAESFIFEKDETQVLRNKFTTRFYDHPNPPKVHRLKCHKNELIVKVWVVEEIIIFWSCVEEKAEGVHDEALLIAMETSSSKDDYKYELSMQKLKTVAKEMLSAQLFNAIQWTIANTWTMNDEIPAIEGPCPPNGKFIFIIVFEVGFLAVFVCLIATAFLSRKRNNVSIIE